MKVALIDSGIRKDLLANACVIEDLVVEESGNIRPRTKKDGILTAHGTVCAQIIERYTDSVEFCSLQIFRDVSESATFDQLSAALRWCFVQNIPIVHMSIGTTRAQDAVLLRRIVAKMFGNGQILVAAYSNSSYVSYPAQFGGVFGVSAGHGLRGIQYETDDVRKDMNFVASSKHVVITPTGDKQETPMANSFAAPTVTAAVCRILKRAKSPMNACEVYYALTGKKAEPMRPDFIEDAIIVNPSNCVLHRTFLFFEVIKYVNSLKELSDDEKENQSIVYIPKKTDDGNPEDDISRIKRLLYCGDGEGTKARERGNPVTTRQSRNQFIWSERDSYLAFNGLPLKKECLYIHVQGGQADCIYVLGMLEKLFLEDGYQCLAVSDIPYSYLYGFEYMRSGDDVTQFLVDIAQSYQLDVLLFAIYENAFFENEDKNREGKSDYFCVSIGKEDCKAHYRIPAKYTKSDIVLLYDYIINMFS